MTNNITGVLKVIIIFSIFTLAGIIIFNIVFPSEANRELALKMIEITGVIIVTAVISIFMIGKRGD